MTGIVKILICAGALGWSTDRVITGVKDNSKYKNNISICYFWLPTDCIFEEWDLIYIHSGAVMNGSAKQIVLDNKDKTKWVVGIRGPTAYKRNWHRLEELWDGYTTGNHWWHEECKPYAGDVPGYVCHGSIDVNRFKPSPFPEDFKIGWAGAPANGTKRFKEFIQLPFDMVIAAKGRGYVRKVYGDDIFNLTKWYPYDEMPDFYPKCSVYVNTSFREGGPLPPKEAGASGRPSVITRTGDGVEWVPEEYIVDKWQDMIPIIERFKSDRELLIEEGKRFHKLAQRWDHSVVAREYDRMFKEILNG